MMLRSVFLGVCIGCLGCLGLLARDHQPMGVFKPPTGGELSQLLHVKYRDHLIPEPGPKRILLVQQYYLHGKAEDLNRFLQDVAKLPSFFRVTVVLTGPNGLNLAEPLTPDAAQAGVPYDWSVQVIPTHDVRIVIPLAGRIPFSALQVPLPLTVETSPGAPHAAEDFARLHNARVGPPE